MVREFALHETLEAHELLTVKNLALTKSTLMSNFAQDEELKSILNDHTVIGKQSVGRLEHLLSVKGRGITKNE